MRIAILVILAVGCVGCATVTQDPAEHHPDMPLEAAWGPCVPPAFGDLDPGEREARIRAADRDFEIFLYHWRGLRKEFQTVAGGGLVMSSQVRGPWRGGMVLRHLERVRLADPTHAEAVYLLGRLQALCGDRVAADGAYEDALAALPYDRRSPETPHLESRIRIEAAWNLRDLGYWDRGLEWLAGHDGRWHRDLWGEARLVQGLLLAGAGRMLEARKVASHLPAMEYPSDGLWGWGANQVRKEHGRRWIRAMAWHGIGEPEMAARMLSAVDLHTYPLPHAGRYYDDLGVIAECVDRSGVARTAFMRSVHGVGAFRNLLPWRGWVWEPMVLERPRMQVPFFTVWETRRVAGSRFSYACYLVTRYQMEEDETRKLDWASRSVEALDECIRRRVMPHRSRALRGRLAYYLGRHGQALVDLEPAVEAFAQAGETDPDSELVIGTILLGDGRPEDALQHLRLAAEVKDREPAVLRSLGVALAQVGEKAAADSVLGCAIDLDPGEPRGWYNRGLFRASLKDWHGATGDFATSLRLDVDNPGARMMFEQAANRLRGEGGAVPEGLSWTRIDSLIAAAPARDDGHPSARPVTAEADSLEWWEVEKSFARTGSVEDRRRLAAICLAQGRAERARSLLGDLAWRVLSDPELRIVLELDRSQGRLERSLAMVAEMEAGGAASEDPEVWALVAVHCIEAGSREQGLAALDRALALDPGNTGLKLYRQLVTGRGADPGS